MLDTLKARHDLIEVGFDEKQAEVIVRIEQQKQDEVATKDFVDKKITEVKIEVAETKTALKTEIAEVKTELKAEIERNSTKIEKVNTKIAEVKTELKTEIERNNTKIEKVNTKVDFLIKFLYPTILIIIGGLIKLVFFSNS